MTEPRTTAEAIEQLTAAIAASRAARAVDLVKAPRPEPWEINELTELLNHDLCPARRVGGGPIICMIHHVEIPR